MSLDTPPIPVVFDPLFKTKPWGGRRLADLFGKRLPPGDPVGESWELVSLPDNESPVRGGPLAGTTLAALVEGWGTKLRGQTSLFDGRFPLLIKFLDACENLSVQVHPKPDENDPTGWRPGIKHECWYVLHAEPDAKLYIGLKPDVTPADLERVANTPAMVDVLRVWPGRVGQCYYLPSGTLHALGAGLVVAEVQTPSDVTYRAYDWERVGLDGQPRELHIKETLENTRYDVTEDMILQPRAQVVGPLGTTTRVAACERFVLDLVHVTEPAAHVVSSGRLRIWIMLDGRGQATCEHGGQAFTTAFAKGDVLLIPAGASDTQVQLETPGDWIEVTIPDGRG